jgi:hypothetical protein
MSNALGILFYFSRQVGHFTVSKSANYARSYTSRNDGDWQCVSLMGFGLALGLDIENLFECILHFIPFG